MGCAVCVCDGVCVVVCAGHVCVGMWVEGVVHAVCVCVVWCASRVCGVCGGCACRVCV